MIDGDVDVLKADDLVWVNESTIFSTNKNHRCGMKHDMELKWLIGY